MTDPVVLGSPNQIKFVKEATTIQKTPASFNFAVGAYGAAQLPQGTNYIVPPDKKFVITHMVVGATGDTTMNCYYHTTPNVAGGTYFFEMTRVVKGIASFPVYFEIPAGNYINTTCNLASVRPHFIGVECDA